MLAATGLLCVIWGTTWEVIQIGLVGVPPMLGVSIRFGLAGALLLGLAWARGVPLGRRPHEVKLWVMNGVLAFCMSYAVVYWAEQWVPSGLTAVIFATYPLFVAILAHFLLPAERLGGIERFGIALGFGGIAVIFSSDFRLLGGPQVAFAAALALISPFVSAVASVVIKRWGAGVHPLSLTSIPMLIAAALTGTLALLFESDRPVVWSGPAIGAIIYLTIMGSAVTFTVYYWLLSYWPAKRLALIAYIVPLIAVAIGTATGEPLTVRIAVGTGLVLFGVALAIHSHSRRPAR